MTLERLPLPARIVRPLGYPRVVNVPEEQQDGMRVFWLDGLFASVGGGFSDPYYTLYMLSLGATNAQIGLVNTLTQFAGATLAMPGAAIADRTGRYKQMTVVTGSVARLMWIVMLIAPWLLTDHAAVWLILAAWVAISAVGALGISAWTALSADLVPVRLRGGYFASRNIISQLGRLIAIPIAGQIINSVGEPQGYQVGLALAFLFGIVSLYFNNCLPEHRTTEHEQKLGLREALHNIRGMPTFLRFMLSHAVLMFGAMIGGPFISVYMVQEINFSVGTIGLVTTVNVFAALIGLRLLGRLQDRHGITWVMRFGLGVPLLPVMWLWVQHPWHAYLLNGFAALTWAGYNLGAFSLLLASTPDAHRPRYIAINTTVVSLTSALGPLLGGALLDASSFKLIFSLSTIVRALGLILFLLLVREPAKPDDLEDNALDGT